MATAFGKGEPPAKFHGKSTSKLGHGGRAAKLKSEGVPGAVIGAIARSKGAARVVRTIAAAASAGAKCGPIRIILTE